MVEVTVSYTGDLHCDATHGPSCAKISTDAPTDNRGKGETFSPTDLVATALATCMSTTMGIVATDAPRRIVGLPSEVHIPLPADCPERALLEKTALNCPVHKSLPPEIDRP